MARVTYNDALCECMNQPAIPNCKMSCAEIEQAIKQISEQLVGPLPNAERLMLVAERSELRATLATLSA